MISEKLWQIFYYKVISQKDCKLMPYVFYSKMVLKLYSVSDGPPSLAVRMTLKALEIPFELVEVDFAAGDHMTEEYDKVMLLTKCF